MAHDTVSDFDMKETEKNL